MVINKVMNPHLIEWAMAHSVKGAGAGGLHENLLEIDLIIVSDRGE